MKYVLIGLFILGLVYVLSPEPKAVGAYPPLPNSLKSDEPGDTHQIPNVAAYFSDFDRAYITSFYRNSFRMMFPFGFLLPPVTLNHPPQYARMMIRDQLYVTFLEEYLYPLRGSIMVAGYEPYIDNELLKRDHTFLGDRIHINGRFFVSKITLKFYPTDWYVRLIVYLGVWFSIIGIYQLSKKVCAKNTL